MTKKSPSDKKGVKDQELWEHLRNSILPLKDKYRHTIFPVSETHIRTHHIQESRVKTYFDNQIQDLPVDTYSFSGHQALSVGQSHRKQIRVKKVCIEARLDLHGLTRASALEILQRFIVQAQLRGHEWILVITGKGNDENPVTLRKLLPQWLDQISQVGGYALAKPKDGGSGAYYVRIRRSL
jgi:DNA-nicking Smr family endonuclease